MNVDPDVDDSGDLPQDPERHGVQVAALDHADQTLRCPGSLGECCLAPAATTPDGADGAPDPLIRHSPSIRTGRYQPLISPGS
jgi:hypothetical protein